MNGGVDLSVAAAIDSVSACVSGAHRDRRETRGACELGVVGEAPAAGHLADELGGRQRADTRLHQQLRRDVSDKLTDLERKRGSPVEVQ